MGITTCMFQQFNPSTLKAKYNPATQKAQTVTHTMNCIHCANGTMPYAVMAALSDFEDVGCCPIPGSPVQRADEFVDLATEINNETYKMVSAQFGFWPDYNSCEYQYSELRVSPANFGKHRTHYGTGLCNTGTGWGNWYYLLLSLYFTATGVDVVVTIGNSSGSWLTRIFCGSAVVDCDEIAAIEITNTISSCYQNLCVYAGNWFHPCSGTGKVTLTGLYC